MKETNYICNFLLQSLKNLSYFPHLLQGKFYKQYKEPTHGNIKIQICIHLKNFKLIYLTHWYPHSKF